MSRHLQRQVETLKKKVLQVGSLVEEAIAKALKALITRDLKLAEEVIDADDIIDRTEVDVEEEVLKTLALHQPVAADLRFCVAVLKINNDLERMGDLARNIAKRRVSSQSASRSISLPTFARWPRDPRRWSSRVSTPWSTPTRRWHKKFAIPTM